MEDQQQPAFPLPEYAHFSRSERNEGMTLRDYFAAKAFNALLMTRGDSLTQEIARAAYDYADAMLKARNS